MFNRIFAPVLLLLGLLFMTVPLMMYFEQIDLLLRGEQVAAKVADIVPDGKAALNQSKAQFASDVPKAVDAFRLSYVFKTPAGLVKGADRLSYFEIADLTGEQLLLYENRYKQQLIGCVLQVRYQADAPERNVIVRSLPAEGFYIPFFSGFGLFAVGLSGLSGRLKAELKS